LIKEENGNSNILNYIKENILYLLKIFIQKMKFHYLWHNKKNKELDYKNNKKRKKRKRKKEQKKPRKKERKRKDKNKIQLNI